MRAWSLMSYQNFWKLLAEIRLQANLMCIMRSKGNPEVTPLWDKSRQYPELDKKLHHPDTTHKNQFWEFLMRTSLLVQFDNKPHSNENWSQEKSVLRPKRTLICLTHSTSLTRHVLARLAVKKYVKAWILWECTQLQKILTSLWAGMTGTMTKDWHSKSFLKHSYPWIAITLTCLTEDPQILFQKPSSAEMTVSLQTPKSSSGRCGGPTSK